MHSVRWQSIVDFVVLGFALYALLRWAKLARAIRIALGIVGLFTGALIARHLDLVVTSWVLQAAGLVTLLLLLMVFQAELRRDVMRLDRLLRFGLRRYSVVASDSRMIADAAFWLAKSRLGALIVVARHDPVSELVDAGITFGAEISVETLEAIFEKESPLHDGAAIIEGERIYKVNAVLPLTQRGDVPNSYGTRHRAAMGLAERCDAVVITVSEERSEVTLMQGREIRRMPNQEVLVSVLDALQGPKTSLSVRVRSALVSNLRLKLVAAGLAAIIWGVSFLATSTTVRIVSVPVQFSDVSPGMDISEQSATRLEVQLRGSPWLMESSNINSLVANFDLRGIRQGWLTLRVSPEDLNLPPGVVVERAFPKTLSVHLAAQAPSGSS